MIIDRARVAAALPAYELGRQLGAGSFGLVLEARHLPLDRDVAVKILSAGHDGAQTSFQAEARVLAGIDHPHVVRVYDYVEVEDDGFCLIIMELLPGGTLTRRRAGMSAESACAVGLAVAEALSCAHDKGVLHRDIKTDNILFDADGLLKVTDFGVAKIFEGSAATASAVVGTPKYMAPEQVTGGRLGPATDLYALGVVLCELLAGAPPFDPKVPLLELYRQHLDVAPSPIAGVPSPVRDDLTRVVSARASGVLRVSVGCPSGRSDPVPSPEGDPSVGHRRWATAGPAAVGRAPSPTAGLSEQGRRSAPAAWSLCESVPR